MIIRKEQMTALSLGTEERFGDRLVAFLRQEFPEAAAQPLQELKAAVQQQDTKARQYGLDNGQDIAVYVVTAWLLGEDFDTEFPAAAETLGSTLSSDLKAHWLSAWTEKLFAALEAAPQ